MQTSSKNARSADTLFIADAGCHSKDNLQALAELNVTGLIADNQPRQRDERLAGQDKHKAKADPLYDKGRFGRAKKSGLYRTQDFTEPPTPVTAGSRSAGCTTSVLSGGCSA